MFIPCKLPIYFQFKLFQGLCSKCFQNCDVRSDSVLECPFPVLPSSDLRKKRSTNNDIHTTVGFVMDGVESVRNISAYFPDVPSSLKVAPNPVYNKFKNGWRVYGGGALELQVGIYFLLLLSSFITQVRGEAGTDTSRRFFFPSSSQIPFYCHLHQMSPLPHPVFSSSLPNPAKSLFTQSSHLSHSLPLLLLSSTLSASALFINHSTSTLSTCPA